MTIVKLIQDTDCQSPRENDNLGTMVCVHRNYNLGDENGDELLSEDIRNHSKYNSKLEDEYDFSNPSHLFEVAQKIGLFGVVLPLFLYDHSGITMNTTGFSCHWDSGQVGFIYVTKEKLRKEYSVKRISKKFIKRIESYLISEVNVYDQYLQNDIYGFQVINDDDEVINSCWGFYGSNVSDNGMLEHIEEEYHDLALEAEISYLE